MIKKKKKKVTVGKRPALWEESNTKSKFLSARCNHTGLLPS